ncbi:MAG: bifunctional phosphoglucose/phosphomannose isomerase [Patescibacteria group bacterium]|nr:bifunctional phosphoglucose/phosphomannose isomerase [Patescibacteria group bacterium]
MNVMEKAIQDFPKQFAWEPEVINSDKLGKYSRYVLVGMGGSRLSGDLLNTSNPEIDLLVRSDYGLPSFLGKDTLVICSSYSGNTEEVLSVFKEAQKKSIPVAVLAKGGKLIELAKKEDLPYIQFPDTGIQPRSAIGFSFRGLVKLIGREDILKDTESLKDVLSVEDNGKDIAEVLHNKIPVIYSSFRNRSLGYIFKITLNETGKIPAFYNVLPEANHNEMIGFDIIDSTKELSENLHFVFLKDEKDNKRIQKRMEVLEQLYKDRGFEVEVVAFKGKSVFERMFSSILLADWTAYHISKLYGTQPNEVPMVEEFKKLIL